MNLKGWNKTFKLNMTHPWWKVKDRKWFPIRQQWVSVCFNPGSGLLSFIIHTHDRGCWLSWQCGSGVAGGFSPILECYDEHVVSCTVAWAIEKTICEAADTDILRHSQTMGTHILQLWTLGKSDVSKILLTVLLVQNGVIQSNKINITTSKNLMFILKEVVLTEHAL